MRKSSFLMFRSIRDTLQFYFVHVSVNEPALFQIFYYVYLLTDAFELVRSALSHILHINPAVEYIFHTVIARPWGSETENIGIVTYTTIAIHLFLTIILLTFVIYASRRVKSGREINAILSFIICLYTYYITISSLSLVQIAADVTRLIDSAGFLLVELMYFVIICIQFIISNLCFCCVGRTGNKLSRGVIIMDKKYENIHFSMRYVINFIERAGSSPSSNSINYLVKFIWYLTMALAIAEAVPYHTVSLNVLRASTFSLAAIVSLVILVAMLTATHGFDPSGGYNKALLLLMGAGAILAIALTTYRVVGNCKRSRNSLVSQNIHNDYNNRVNPNFVYLNYNRRCPRRFLSGLMYELLDKFDDSQLVSDGPLMIFVKGLLKGLIFKYGNNDELSEYYIRLLCFVEIGAHGPTITRYLNIAKEYHIPQRETHFCIVVASFKDLSMMKNNGTKSNDIMNEKARSLDRMTKKIQMASAKFTDTVAITEEILRRELDEADERSPSTTFSLPPSDIFDSFSAIRANHTDHHRQSLSHLDTQESGQQKITESSEHLSTITLRLHHNSIRRLNPKNIPTEALPSIGTMLVEANTSLYKLDKYTRYLHKSYRSLLGNVSKRQLDQLPPSTTSGLFHDHGFDELFAWEGFHFGADKSRDYLEDAFRANGGKGYNEDASRMLRRIIRKRKEFEYSDGIGTIAGLPNVPRKGRGSTRDKLTGIEEKIHQRHFKINNPEKRRFVKSNIKHVMDTFYSHVVLANWGLSLPLQSIVGSLFVVLFAIITYSFMIRTLWKINSQGKYNKNVIVSFSELLQTTMLRNEYVIHFAEDVCYPKITTRDNSQLQLAGLGMRTTGVQGLATIHKSFQNIPSELALKVNKYFGAIHVVSRKILINRGDICGISIANELGPTNSVIRDSTKLISLSYIYGASSGDEDKSFRDEGWKNYVSEELMKLENSFDIITYEWYVEQLGKRNDIFKNNPGQTTSLGFMVFLGLLFSLSTAVITVLGSIPCRLKPMIGILRSLLAKIHTSSSGRRRTERIKSLSGELLNNLIFKVVLCVVKISLITFYLWELVDNYLCHTRMYDLVESICLLPIYDPTPLNILRHAIIADYHANMFMMDGDPNHMDVLLESNIVINGYRLLSTKSAPYSYTGEDACIPLFDIKYVGTLWGLSEEWEIIWLAAIRIAFESAVIHTTEIVDGKEVDVVTYDTSKFILANPDLEIDINNIRIKEKIMKRLIVDYNKGILCDNFSYTTVTSMKPKSGSIERGKQTITLSSDGISHLEYFAKGGERFLDSFFYKPINRVTPLNPITTPTQNWYTFFSETKADINNCRKGKWMFNAVPTMVMNSEWFNDIRSSVYSDTYDIQFNNRLSEKLPKLGGNNIQMEFAFLILFVLIFFDEWYSDRVIWKHTSKRLRVFQAMMRVLIDLGTILGMLATLVANIKEREYQAVLFDNPKQIFLGTTDSIVSVYFLTLQTFDVVKACASEAGKHFAMVDSMDTHSCLTKAVLDLKDLRKMMGALDNTREIEGYALYPVIELENMIKTLEETLIVLYPFSVFYGKNKRLEEGRYIEGKLVDIFESEEGTMLFAGMNYDNIDILQTSVREFLSDGLNVYKEALVLLYSRRMEAKIRAVCQGIINYVRDEYEYNFTEAGIIKDKIISNNKIVVASGCWLAVNIFSLFIFILSTLSNWINELVISKVGPLPKSIHSAIPRFGNRKTLAAGISLGVLGCALYLVPLLTLSTNFVVPHGKSQDMQIELRHLISGVQFLVNSLQSLLLADRIGEGDSEGLSVFDKLQLVDRFKYAAEEYDTLIMRLADSRDKIMSINKVVCHGECDVGKEVDDILVDAQYIGVSIDNILDCLYDYEYGPMGWLDFNGMQERPIVYCFKDTEDGGGVDKDDETSSLLYTGLVNLLKSHDFEGENECLYNKIEFLIQQTNMSEKIYEGKRLFVVVSLYVLVIIIVVVVVLLIVIGIRRGDAKHIRANNMLVSMKELNVQ